ncbi:hydrogen peroxide-inducible genes activator [Pelagibius sp.]|uniref:hydrogen peroxide-inducible genes activator n=1 Tax=Pelagibius sp. TaxID=1931238 RepID=UPI002618BD50|nr:hydrogen peroxide-inducible genes activator [Pelagibius sp.]
MIPSLKQLRYLVAIADTLHFRRAAELSHVSQPTLSGQLRELEQRLGVQLVERSRAKVVLTPIGKEIATRARVVLRHVQDLVELAEQDKGVLGGTLRLGVLPTLGPYLLRHILPELHLSYPELKLYIREGSPTALLQDLDEGRLDLLIFALPVKGADLKVARLFREPLLIAASSDHGLAAKDFAERADLKGETVLGLERGYHLHAQVRELCELYGARLSLDYEGTSLDTLRQMVGMGMGLTFLPALYVRSEIPKDEEVVVRPLRSRPPSRSIGLVWRRHSARSDEFAALAGVMRGIVKSGVPEVTVLS